MNKERLEELNLLFREMVYEVNQMRNQIGTGPTIMGVKTFSSNRQRFLMLKKYKEIREKYYKQAKELDWLTRHYDLFVMSMLRQPLVRSEGGIRIRDFDHSLVQVVCEDKGEGA